MNKQNDFLLLDDLDGSSADERVKFAVDGIDYEVDLSSANAAAFRSYLGVFMNAGRRKASAPAVQGRKEAPLSVTARIRRWAAEQGYELSSRGQIPKSIVQAFQAAEAGTA